MLRKTLLTVSVLLMLCTADLLAQSPTTTMDASAYSMTSIVLDRTSNLSFGSVTVGAEGGTVVITQGGNRSKTGDVALVNSNHGAANVTITAQEMTWVLIDLPGGTLLKDASNNELTMVFDPSINGPVETGETGILNMLIGGTVYIPAAAPVGEYTGSVQLSVVYF